MSPSLTFKGFCVRIAHTHSLSLKRRVRPSCGELGRSGAFTDGVQAWTQGVPRWGAVFGDVFRVFHSLVVALVRAGRGVGDIRAVRGRCVVNARDWPVNILSTHGFVWLLFQFGGALPAHDLMLGGKSYHCEPYFPMLTHQ